MEQTILFNEEYKILGGNKYYDYINNNGMPFLYIMSPTLNQNVLDFMNLNNDDIYSVYFDWNKNTFTIFLSNKDEINQVNLVDPSLESAV